MGRRDELINLLSLYSLDSSSARHVGGESRGAGSGFVLGSGETGLAKARPFLVQGPYCLVKDNSMTVTVKRSERWLGWACRKHRESQCVHPGCFRKNDNCIPIPNLPIACCVTVTLGKYFAPLRLRFPTWKIMLPQCWLQTSNPSALFAFSPFNFHNPIR